MARDFRNELLQQQLEMYNPRARRAREVNMSRSTGISYNAELQKMVRQIRRDFDEIVMPIVRGLEREYQADGWSDDIRAALDRLRNRWSSPEFLAATERMASLFVRTADQVNRQRFGANMRSIGINTFGDSPELSEYLRASVFDNTRLVRSIPSEFLDRVESIVLTNVRAGGRPAAIADLIREQTGVTQRRAAFIARDQTAKVNGDLVRRRQVNVGFEYFQWITSDDERVRDRHDEIADKLTAYGQGIYRWDNPPLSGDGNPIIPGQDYGCRCTARPVQNSEVEANQTAGRVAKGVLR